MAKTSNSLTGDPSIKGAPTDFTLNVNNIFVSVGARFIVPIVGEVSFTINFLILLNKKSINELSHYIFQILMMPGLSTRPSIYDMDWNSETGEIEGLF